jgi:hypothetical protein
MVELYEENGVQKEDAEIILNTMSKYKTFFLKHMVRDMQHLSANRQKYQGGARVTFHCL